MVRNVRVRQWTACGLPVVLVLLLGACSGSSDPKVLPLPTLSSTASPSPTPLVVPSAAAANTPQGAAAFARFYFEQLNQAFLSLDGSVLRSFAAPGCETCENYAGAVERLRAAGHRLDGGQYKLIFAEAPAFEPGLVTVDLAWRRAAARELDAAGSVVKSGAEEVRRDGQMSLEWRNRQWAVRGIRIMAAPK